MKVYLHDGSRYAALCRGILANEIRDLYRGKAIPTELEKIYEAELDIPLEELEAAENAWYGYVQFWRDKESGKFTLTPYQSASFTEVNTRYDKFYLVDTRTTLLPNTNEGKEYPYFCTLFRSDDGRLSGRIEYRSDRDGCFNKLVFPDRSWKNAISGSCWVKIVKDLPGYAFVKGAYTIGGTPASIDEVVQSLWDDLKKGAVERRSRIYAVKDSILGSFIGTSDDCGYNVAFIKDNDKVVEKTVCLDQTEMQEDIARHIDWELAAEDLLIQYSFDEYDSAEELFGRFTPCSYSGDDPDGKKVGFWIASPSLGSNAPIIAHEANDMGILTRNDLVSRGANIHSITVSRYNIFKLAAFTASDVEELISYVNKTNAEANERVVSAVRKGKFTIQVK